MDSLTHIVLGATTGELFRRNQPGRQAMWIGALAQSFPDIDFITYLWMDPAEDLLAHRGFTHSIFFAVLSALALGFLAGRRFPSGGMSAKEWFGFFCVQFLLHDGIDAFNAYGTGWFEPFSHYRVSFHTLYVADPLFSLGIALSVLALIFLSADHRLRKKVAWAGITWCMVFLGYAISNKIRVNEVALGKPDRMEYHRAFSTPTPFNTWLWQVIVEEEGGYRIGFRSVFDESREMEWTFFSRNDSLLKSADPEMLFNLKRFSQGYYTAEMRGDTLVFNDLRFGQNGWDNPGTEFTFHFYVNYPGENRTVVQRGRLKHWTMGSLWRRIKGD